MLEIQRGMERSNHFRDAGVEGQTITLYNKNKEESYKFENAVLCMNRHGYIAERGELPIYFKNVIQEEKE